MGRNNIPETGNSLHKGPVVGGGAWQGHKDHWGNHHIPLMENRCREMGNESTDSPWEIQNVATGEIPHETRSRVVF